MVWAAIAPSPEIRVVGAAAEVRPPPELHVIIRWRSEHSYDHVALVPIDAAGMGSFDVHPLGVHGSGIVVENAIHAIAMVRVWHSCPLGMVEYTPILSKINTSGAPSRLEPRSLHERWIF